MPLQTAARAGDRERPSQEPLLPLQRERGAGAANGTNGRSGLSTVAPGAETHRDRDRHGDGGAQLKKFLREDAGLMKRTLGRMMKACAPGARCLYLVWQYVLANALVGCAFLLYCKIAHKEWILLDLNKRIAELGNWNLQLANLLLLASYSASNYLILRTVLCLACFSFVLYALTSPVGYMLDMLLFNFSMALINGYYAVTHLYRQRYVEFPPEFEQAYRARFREFLSRTDFELLASEGFVRGEVQGVFLKKRGDNVTSLCMLVDGEVEVMGKDGIQVVDVHGANDLLEAPEWMRSGLNPDESRFDVSLRVSSPSVTFLKWPREAVVTLLEEHPQIRPALHAVLGIQTATVWTRMVSSSAVGRTLSGFNAAEGEREPQGGLSTKDGGSASPAAWSGGGTQGRPA